MPDVQTQDVFTGAPGIILYYISEGKEGRGLEVWRKSLRNARGVGGLKNENRYAAWDGVGGGRKKRFLALLTFWMFPKSGPNFLPDMQYSAIWAQYFLYSKYRRDTVIRFSKIYPHVLVQLNSRKLKNQNWDFFRSRCSGAILRGKGLDTKNLPWTFFCRRKRTEDSENGITFLIALFVPEIWAFNILYFSVYSVLFDPYLENRIFQNEPNNAL